MGECAIGSIWTVAGIDRGVAVVLAGPFAVARGVPEYLVAPFYDGNEPGFAWTDEDVRLESTETGLAGVRFAAIWNARPVLREDLQLQVGLLQDAATVDVRDVYWSSLNEQRVSGPRLGKAIRSRREAVAAFQESELARWALASGRAIAKATEREAFGAVLGRIQFTMPTTGFSLFVSSDSLPSVLCADPRTISDDRLFGGAQGLLWYGASMGGSIPVTPTSLGFAANNVTEFEKRITLTADDSVTEFEYARCA